MKRFQNILVVQEDDDPRALAEAARLARRNKAALKIIRVLPELPESMFTTQSGTIFDLQAAAWAEAQDALEALVADVANAVPVEVQVREGSDFVEIIREVLRSGHDLVIKSAVPVDFSDRVFGSLDLHLVRKSPCPVWLLAGAETKGRRHVLAAIDTSRDDDVQYETNRLIVQLAASQAARMNARLSLVSAWDLPGETMLRGARTGLTSGEVDQLLVDIKQKQQKRIRRLANEAKLSESDYEKHLLKGDPIAILDAFIRKNAISLVVMGTVTRTSLAGFLISSKAETILSTLTCSVLTVKPPGFQSPIKLDDATRQNESAI